MSHNMSQQRIKVLQLQLTPNLNPSDLPEQLINGLPKAQFEVTSAFLTKENPDYRDFTQAEHVKFFNLSDKQIKGSRKQAVKAVLDYIKAENIEIVIGHRFKPTDILVKVNAKHRLTGMIGVIHGSGDFKRWYRKLSFRRNLRDNCKIVGVSSAVKSYLLSAGAGFNESNIVVINNAIDIARIENLLLPRAQSRQALKIEQNDFVIGCIGRLVPVKWHQGLIDAYRPLIKNYPHSKLCIIGGGRLESELKDYVKAQGLEDNVLLTGKLPVASEYLTAFDCFALPSLSEGLPLSLLEAMAAKLPVIGSDIPSIRPVIEDVGLLFPVKDQAALTAELEKLITMPEAERLAMGQSHYQHLVKNHRIEDYRASFEQLVRSFC